MQQICATSSLLSILDAFRQCGSIADLDPYAVLVDNFGTVLCTSKQTMWPKITKQYLAVIHSVVGVNITKKDFKLLDSYGSYKRQSIFLTL